MQETAAKKSSQNRWKNAQFVEINRLVNIMVFLRVRDAKAFSSGAYVGVWRTRVELLGIVL